jgi:hypothetical protein
MRAGDGGGGPSPRGCAPEPDAILLEKQGAVDAVAGGRCVSPGLPGSPLDAPSYPSLPCPALPFPPLPLSTGSY